MKTPPFQRALVTGANSGIGLALCRLLARKGISLMMTGRDEGRLNLAAEELRKYVDVIAFTADLAECSQRKIITERIFEFVPDLVINNAGFGLYGEILSHETEKQMNIIRVDVAAVLEFSIEAARALVSANKKGVILNVSSAAGFQIFPLFAAYASSKAFVNSFSEAFDDEMKPYGIRVLAACPGVVDTRFRERASESAQTKETHSGLSMTQDYAAEEIWKQIQSGKPVHIFNWKYRFLTFITKLLPKRLVLRLLRRSIEERHKPREIILYK